MQLLATAAFGLEAVVARELKALGYEPRVVSPGRIAFVGDGRAIARTNLWLRSAERVLIEMARFEATDFDQLFEGVKAAEWAEFIPPDGAVHVRGRSHKSQLSSVPACQKITKKSIVDSLLAGHGVETLPEDGHTYTVEVALVDNEASLTLDTTGVGLHKRGYRPAVARAPLRETLAAGILQLTFWKNGRPLLDPFCGAGTFAIEAALLGRQMAPGMWRQFAAEQWPAIDVKTWREARDEAESVVLPPLEERIVATDADSDVLKLARRNAADAGVDADIHFQERRFEDTLSRREHGVLVANPPYGERIGEQREVEQLYRQMPTVLRRLKTWSHYILTSHDSFEALVGQKADRRRKLYNGRLACTLFQFYGPKPPRDKKADKAASAGRATPTKKAAAAGRASTQHAPTDSREPFRDAANTQAFGGLKDEASRQATEFANRMTKRARHLRRWPTKRDITCFRLYDRDIPEAPLAVDRYQSVEGELWLHVAEYDRPHDRTPAEHADWLDHLMRSAADALDVPRKRVLLKRRARQRGDEQYQKQGDQRVEFTVEEGGLRFKVNLSDYIDTGLFLDHREARGMVRDEAKGKRVLNLFAYTGAFSVYAAAGGAVSTTTVDLSPTYCQWAQHNLSMNGFGDAAHQVVQADCREFVAQLPREPLYDLAVIDPPTFSNSKRTDADWETQRDGASLIVDVAARMPAGAVIYFSTNNRRFKLDEAALDGLAIREISHRTVPEDFRNKRIHRCWRMVVAG